MATKKELEKRIKELENKMKENKTIDNETKTFLKLGLIGGTMLGIPSLAKQLHK